MRRSGSSEPRERQEMSDETKAPKRARAAREGEAEANLCYRLFEFPPRNTRFVLRVNFPIGFNGRVYCVQFGCLRIFIENDFIFVESHSPRNTFGSSFLSLFIRRRVGVGRLRPASPPLALPIFLCLASHSFFHSPFRYVRLFAPFVTRESPT